MRRVERQVDRGRGVGDQRLSAVREQATARLARRRDHPLHDAQLFALRQSLREGAGDTVPVVVRRGRRAADVPQTVRPGHRVRLCLSGTDLELLEMLRTDLERAGRHVPLPQPHDTRVQRVRLRHAPEPGTGHPPRSRGARRFSKPSDVREPRGSELADGNRSVGTGQDQNVTRGVVPWNHTRQKSHAGTLLPATFLDDAGMLQRGNTIVTAARLRAAFDLSRIFICVDEFMKYRNEYD